MRTEFSEQIDYWTMLKRRVDPGNGVGKWKLDSPDPRPVYDLLAEAMREGRLRDVSAIKMRTVPDRAVETVYVYCAPYSDIPGLFRVAAELMALVQDAGVHLEKSLKYKTDLQTIWQKETNVPKDKAGKPLAWRGRSWLYSYDGGRSVVNRDMLLMHEELETCDPTALTALGSLRRQLPAYAFAYSGLRVDDRIEAERGWLTVSGGSRVGRGP